MPRFWGESIVVALVVSAVGHAIPPECLDLLDAASSPPRRLPSGEHPVVDSNYPERARPVVAALKIDDQADQLRQEIEAIRN